MSSALGGAATSFGMLVTARTLQGVFGAILAPAALGTLVSTFREPRERGRAIGVVGACGRLAFWKACCWSRPSGPHVSRKHVFTTA